MKNYSIEVLMTDKDRKLFPAVVLLQEMGIYTLKELKDYLSTFQGYEQFRKSLKYSQFETLKTMFRVVTGEELVSQMMEELLVDNLLQPGNQTLERVIKTLKKEGIFTIPGLEALVKSNTAEFIRFLRENKIGSKSLAHLEAAYQAKTGKKLREIGEQVINFQYPDKMITDFLEAEEIMTIKALRNAFANIDGYQYVFEHIGGWGLGVLVDYFQTVTGESLISDAIKDQIIDRLTEGNTHHLLGRIIRGFQRQHIGTIPHLEKFAEEHPNFTFDKSEAIGSAAFDALEAAYQRKTGKKLFPKMKR